MEFSWPKTVELFYHSGYRSGITAETSLFLSISRLPIFVKMNQRLLLSKNFRLNDSPTKIQARCTHPGWWILVFGFLISSVSCASSAKNYDPQKKFDPSLLQQEVQMIRTTYEKCHPGLYWYTPKDSMDRYFDQLYRAVSDSLTEIQYQLLLAKTLAHINCGHTSVRNSKAAARYHPQKPEPIFPLQVKVWDRDSMVVLANVYREDSLLKRGTAIYSINGVPVKEILDSLCLYISGDGYNLHFKHQLLSNNFPFWYKTVFGQAAEYSFTCKPLNGQPQTVVLKAFNPPTADSLKKLAGPTRPQPQRQRGNRLERYRKLRIDTANSLAILELSSFTKGHLHKFFRKSFQTLRENNIQNLAIELRGNGGGKIMHSTLLSRYIANKPFKIADTVVAKSFRYPYPGIVKQGFWYKVHHLLVARPAADGYHYRYYEKKYFKPKTTDHYKGKVFVLTGGFTFSASILFIQSIKGQDNVVVVGEETGGSAYGNSAVNIPEMKLPHTGLRVRLPLYRLVINKNQPRDGRGILPDLPVPPSSWHLAKLLDPKMMRIIDTIKNSSRSLTGVTPGQ